MTDFEFIFWGIMFGLLPWFLLFVGYPVALALTYTKRNGQNLP